MQVEHPQQSPTFPMTQIVSVLDHLVDRDAKQRALQDLLNQVARQVADPQGEAKQNLSQRHKWGLLAQPAHHSPEGDRRQGKVLEE